MMSIKEALEFEKAYARERALLEELSNKFELSIAESEVEDEMERSRR